MSTITAKCGQTVQLAKCEQLWKILIYIDNLQPCSWRTFC